MELMIFVFKLKWYFKNTLCALCLEYPIDDVGKKSEQLAKYLWSRHMPIEADMLKKNSEQLELKILLDGWLAFV